MKGPEIVARTMTVPSIRDQHGNEWAVPLAE